MGAREHYALPLGLERAGLLQAAYTDVWCPPALARLKPPFHWPAFQRLQGRHAPALEGRMRSPGAAGLFGGALHLLRRPAARRFGRQMRHAASFDAFVAASLGRLESAPTVFVAYSGAALEGLASARARGALAVLDQVDPGPGEDALVAEERLRWPGWEKPRVPRPAAHWDQQRKEWAAADLIVVNSDWSRRALLGQGVPAAKMEVLPLAFDGPAPAPKAAPTGRLRVLWLGTVCLRKGIHVLVEAAARLPQMDFDVVGPSAILPGRMAAWPANVRVHGPAPRAAAALHYRAADAFVLPTLSDGYAITQLEAMAWGLPVVATERCGELVRDGVNGYKVPAGDPAALEGALRRLDEDRSRLPALAEAAAATASGLSPEKVARLWVEAAARAGRAA
jgi:hypothetical protein